MANKIRLGQPTYKQSCLCQCPDCQIIYARMVYRSQLRSRNPDGYPIVKCPDCEQIKDKAVN